MKKKPAKTNDVNILMAQIQQQLAVLDRKLDAFMTKSLNELAQALAASKPAQVVHVPSSSAPRPNDRPARQMYAVVCFECGKDTEIPFKPSGDRPVYCQECFAKRKGLTPRVNDPKPQAFSIAPVSTPAPTAVTSAATKKKVAAKKTVAKKKIVAKKQPKRK